MPYVIEIDTYDSEMDDGNNLKESEGDIVSLREQY